MLIIAAPASAATYTGVAKLPSVVWISDVTPPPVDGLTMHQTMKSFIPSVLVVPAGSSVTFPNDDPFYHSVYSDSPGNAFDIGLYDTGPGKAVRFATPGLVDIHCHVHGSMHATIVVVDGPFAQTTAPNQAYHLDGITPGRHTLHVWTGGSDVSTTTITLK